MNTESRLWLCRNAHRHFPRGPFFGGQHSMQGRENASTHEQNKQKTNKTDKNHTKGTKKQRTSKQAQKSKQTNTNELLTMAQADLEPMGAIGDLGW
jgi:hypothetical protein